MSPTPENGFRGFPSKGLDFFRELAVNNNKVWFEAHRQEYEQFLLEPLKGLVAELAGAMLAIDPELVTIPAVDRTISRIYRDTRFSRNKSPYKSCLWITFKRPTKDWKDAPCFFFEVSAETYRFGMGFYSASRETMDRLREFIERRPAEFRKQVEFLEAQNTFVLEGGQYKRPLNPALPAELQEWHRRKNLYLVCNRDADGRLLSKKLADELRNGFTTLAPLYHFLWRVTKVGRP